MNAHQTTADAKNCQASDKRSQDGYRSRSQDAKTEVTTAFAVQATGQATEQATMGPGTWQAKENGSTAQAGPCVRLAGVCVRPVSSGAR